jgi:hypothetical protein
VRDTAAQREDGRRDGDAAAGERGVAGRATLAFFGGAAAAFFGPIGASESGTGLTLVTVAGAGAVVGAVTLGAAAPPASLAREVAERGPVYEQAFREAYARRLRVRRATAGAIAGLGGVAAGVVALLAVVSAALAGST